MKVIGYKVSAGRGFIDDGNGVELIHKDDIGKELEAWFDNFLPGDEPELTVVPVYSTLTGEKG